MEKGLFSFYLEIYHPRKKKTGVYPFTRPHLGRRRGGFDAPYPLCGHYYIGTRSDYFKAMIRTREKERKTLEGVYYTIHSFPGAAKHNEAATDPKRLYS